MRKRPFHGWTITWALAITQTVGYGVLFYAFGVFVAPMEGELGWTRSQVSGAFSLALLCSGLVALPAGRLADRHGARGLMTLGSLLGGVLVFTWSFVESLSGLYLMQAGIGLAMGLSLYEVAFTVLAVWFRRRRRLALLIVTLVAGLASTIFVPLCTWLLTFLSWREALQLLALLHLLLSVPLHAAVLRRSPTEIGSYPDGAEAAQPERSVTAGVAVRGGGFWWLACAFALDRITVMAVAAHGVVILLERGHPPALVAGVLGFVGVAQLGGRLLFLPSAQRNDLRLLTAIIFGLHSAALLLILSVPQIWALWGFAGLFGLSNGAGTLARAALIAETYGPANYGSISGTVATLVAFVQVIGPLAVGGLRDLSGSYDVALVLLMAVSLTAAFAITQSARPERVLSV